MAQRRRWTELFGRNPPLCFFPPPIGSQHGIPRLLEIRDRQRIDVNADVLCEKSGNSLKHSAFQLAVGLGENLKQIRNPNDKTHWSMRVAVYKRGDPVELAVAGNEHVNTQLVPPPGARQERRWIGRQDRAVHAPLRPLRSSAC
jgi:hypothetical protein